jgi:alpha-galactosidase
MLVSLFTIGFVCVCIVFARAPKDGKTGRLPEMGWNSWNAYECNITEELVLKNAELMISLGLKDAGYQYVNIDDCWSDITLRRNATTKEIIPDCIKFPNGIDGTAAAVHVLGLKFGIYSDAGKSLNAIDLHLLTYFTGTLTCAKYEGSLGYEEIDAATFAKWGVDCKYFHIPRLDFRSC